MKKPINPIEVNKPMSEIFKEITDKGLPAVVFIQSDDELIMLSTIRVGNSIIKDIKDFLDDIVDKSSN